MSLNCTATKHSSHPFQCPLRFCRFFTLTMWTPGPYVPGLLRTGWPLWSLASSGFPPVLACWPSAGAVFANIPPPVRPGPALETSVSTPLRGIGSPPEGFFLGRSLYKVRLSSKQGCFVQGDTFSHPMAVSPFWANFPPPLTSPISSSEFGLFTARFWRLLRHVPILLFKHRSRLL